MENMGIHDEVRNAFLARPIQVGGVSIQPVLAGHMLLLRDRVPEFEAGHLSFEESIDAAAIFSVPKEEVYAMFDWTDQDWLSARRAMACRIDLADVPEVIAAIGRQIDAAFDPALAGSEDQKKTDAAGGSPPSSSPPPSTTGSRPRS